MYKNPYEVLGLENGASKVDVEQAYIRLRDKYRLDMHSEGAKGKEAAKKLNDVENAYNDILTNYGEGGAEYRPEDFSYNESPTDSQSFQSAQTEVHSEGSGEYARIEELIRAKKFADAQKALDDIDNRTADWHYYQSVIYYKLGRLQESKAQLELACSMDPSNQRYQNSLNKLNAKLAGNAQPDIQNNNYNRGYNRSYNQYDNERGVEDGCCAACQTMLCLNCLCDCCCRA